MNGLFKWLFLDELRAIDEAQKVRWNQFIAADDLYKRKQNDRLNEITQDTANRLQKAFSEQLHTVQGDLQRNQDEFFLKQDGKPSSTSEQLKRIADLLCARSP